MAVTSVSDLAGTGIRRLRAERGLTTRDLAALCAEIGHSQITVTVINDIETRRRATRQVTFDELLVLSHVLGCPVLRLLGAETLEIAPGVQVDALTALTGVRPGECATCKNKPHAGFTCNTCGRSG